MYRDSSPSSRRGRGSAGSPSSAGILTREVSTRTKKLAGFARPSAMKSKLKEMASADFSDATFNDGPRDAGEPAELQGASKVLGFQYGGSPGAASRQQQQQQQQKRQPSRERRTLSKKDRNRRLGIAFGLLIADALLSIIFTTLSPLDPRLNEVFASRRLSRTIWVQGIASIIDAIVSSAVVIHVVQGILGASLDNFLEAAATKILQAIFFSLLQTGYPTALRLAWIAVLLLCRVVAAALIFSAAFYSGVLTARPARELPKLIISLLEMGAPVPPPGSHDRAARLFATERPLTIELVERLIRWLVPLKERAAAVGIGRRQVLVIAAFLLLMTGYAAFHEYWSILGDQDEFFVEGQRELIVEQSFSYLQSAAFAYNQPMLDVQDAKQFLPSNVTSSSHRVVMLVLSGLRYDALSTLPTQLISDGAALMQFREQQLGLTESILCKVRAELPSVSLPNWIAMLMGVQPEIHGLLGNRGPAEQQYDSLLSVCTQLGIPATMVGTPWFVDLVRSQLAPLGADGSVSASYIDFEAKTAESYGNDLLREHALMLALNTTSRLVVGQFSEINSAGLLNGHGEYADGSAYATAIKNKAGLLSRVLEAINRPGEPPTTLVITSDHGHLARGGSGGSTSEERDAPLIVYRKGSMLGQLDMNSAAGLECLGEGSRPISTIDLAPTVAGLLGVPVPRHSQGRYVSAVFDADMAVHERKKTQDNLVTLSIAMGHQLFRSLEWWQWRDLYWQQHAFVANFLLNPDVNSRTSLDDFDTSATVGALRTAAETQNDATAFMNLNDELQALYLLQRDEASSGTQSRNQFVAAVFLALVLLLVLFVMQLQTFCDPLCLQPRLSGLFTSQPLIGLMHWYRTKDAKAATYTFGLVLLYYILCIFAFAFWCGFNWSSSIVAQPEAVRDFLFYAVVPGVVVAFLVHRATLLRFAVWPVGANGVGRPPLLTMAFFVVTEEVQAFNSIEMVYLCRFYLLVWSLFTCCVLGVLSSQFSFIIPIIFYNKFIESALWDYRFEVMTMQIISMPITFLSMYALYRWPSTRVDLLAMNAIHQLKVDKADRRDRAAAAKEAAMAARGRPGGYGASPLDFSGASGIEMAGDKEGGRAAEPMTTSSTSADHMKKGQEYDVRNNDDLNLTPQERMALRFDEVHEQLLTLREEQAEIAEEMEHLQEVSEGLQEEQDEILSELTLNQGQINAGVKELEVLIIRRFESMQETEEEQKRLKEAEASAKGAGGDGAGALDDDDDDEMRGLDPAARRQVRRQRLVNEQRKRIAEEEAEKAEADSKIRGMQAELAKLLEANARLQRKVEACEHNIDETRDAIEDMAFQKSQCIVQKENALAVLSGEASYLNEHQNTVQRKSSELTSKMAEIESAISASGYSLQRIKHTNELATADRRRELEALEAESRALQAKFEQVRGDVKTLYQDKAALSKQLLSAGAEASEVEACVSKYRKSVSNLLA